MLILLLAGLAAGSGRLAGRWLQPAWRSGGASPAPTAKRASPLVVRNPNVGEVWESEAAVVVVRLANTTDRPLNLTRIGGN